jgi:SPW repeat
MSRVDDDGSRLRRRPPGTRCIHDKEVGMLMRVIPTSLHAGLDYAVGVILIASPWIFGFADESSAAKWVAVIAGLAMLGMSMVTDYEGGVLAHAIPMRVHLMTDAVLGIFLAISPWLFGFADQGANAWLPFVIIGLGEIGAAAMTDPEPRTHRSRRPHPA